MTLCPFCQDVDDDSAQVAICDHHRALTRKNTAALLGRKDPMTTDNTPDLDSIEARANAATPGPWPVMCWHGTDEGGWAAIGPHHQPDDGVLARALDEPEDDSPDGPVEARALADAAFIAAARTDVPVLVAHARALRAEVAGLRKLLGEARVFVNNDVRMDRGWHPARPVCVDLLSRIDAALAAGQEVRDGHDQ